MKQAYDCGVNFFDTAERYKLLYISWGNLNIKLTLTGTSYANGQSEVVMGMAIKKFGWKRSDLVISTKVNPSPEPGHLKSPRTIANSNPRSTGA